ncbi:hypothetical protein [Streptomyces niveus]|uniref:hypothetical protein n=1 Tax=Streptomyces niveus TaxID=193462 RepID=UPI00343DDDE4
MHEIILMMQAWSPHTFEAIDVAFQRAEGEGASHAWGAGFEPAGRREAIASIPAVGSELGNLRMSEAAARTGHGRP